MKSKFNLLSLTRLTLSSILATLCASSIALAQTAVHVIGVYEGPPSGAGPTIEIKKTAEPVTLILSSYESVVWSVLLDEGALVDKILVNGHESQFVDVRDLATFDDADVPVHFYISEKICYPGDSRSEADAVSFGVFPSKNKQKVMDRFFDAVESNTDLEIDRENSITRNNYSSRFSYVVSDNKIKSRGGKRKSGR